MPNEFVIKNGFISKGNSIVEGDLRVNGQTTLVQPQGSDYIVFSSSTLANSGQTMYIRQTATNTYTFGTSGIGQFMSVGASNLVDFSNQAIQTNGSAIFGSIRPLQPYILNLNEIPSGVTAGTQDYRGVLVDPTVNFGGTYSGNFIGYLHNPTITSIANGRHIAMQIVSGDVLLNTTSGNVGIGTTTPTQKLQVSGNISVSGSVIPNTQIISSSASVTPTYGNDLVAITGLSTNVTINNPTGTWPEGKDLTIRIKDDAVARTITWDTKYRTIGVTLPNTTIASKTTYVGLIYNSIDDKFDVIGSTTEL